MRYKHRGLIGCIAHCNNCDWQEEDYIKAMRKAREHAIKTGHRVSIEKTTYGTYN